MRFVTKCKETSKLKTEHLFILKRMFIWSKIYRVGNHSVNMGVVEIQVGNFLEKEQLSGNFEQLMDRAIAHPVFDRTQPLLTSVNLMELAGPLGHSPLLLPLTFIVDSPL